MSWEEQAACAQVDPHLWHSPRHEDRKAAVWVCQKRCAVRQECLDDALERRERFGIRGGLNPSQRRREEKRREAAAAQRAGAAA